VCTLAGTRCALFLGPSLLNAVEIASGKKLWSYAHHEPQHPVADPIVFDNQVFISVGSSCALLETSRESPRVLWSSSEFDTWLPPPVRVKGCLYGTHLPASFYTASWGGVEAGDLPFRCIDWKTGKVLWQHDMKYVSLIAAGDRLIMLELDGTLHIAEAGPSGYKELASADVLQGAKRPRTFATPPVLWHGRIYCRNYAGELVCIDVRKP